jgi:hypothetical protein
MSTRELQEKIVTNMRKWQKIENAAVATTGKIIEDTDNPMVRMIMEIIQRDSQFHYRVQEFIADSLEHKAIAVSTEDVGNVWAQIEKHIELEKETLKLAHEAADALKGKKMLVQEYLIHYLLEDEEKHNSLLEKLEKIKAGMYPYA